MWNMAQSAMQRPTYGKTLRWVYLLVAFTPYPPHWDPLKHLSAQSLKHLHNRLRHVSHSSWISFPTHTVFFLQAGGSSYFIPSLFFMRRDTLSVVTWSSFKSAFWNGQLQGTVNEWTGDIWMNNWTRRSSKQQKHKRLCLYAFFQHFFYFEYYSHTHNIALFLLNMPGVSGKKLSQTITSISCMTWKGNQEGSLTITSWKYKTGTIDSFSWSN